MSGVEHVDHIDAKVFLKPLDVKVGAVEHFNQRPVGEYLVEAMHFGSQFDGVYDKVVGARRDLHQAGEAQEGSEAVVLKIDSNFLDLGAIVLAQMLTQPNELFQAVNVFERRLI